MTAVKGHRRIQEEEDKKERTGEEVDKDGLIQGILDI